MMPAFKSFGKARLINAYDAVAALLEGVGRVETLGL